MLSRLLAAGFALSTLFCTASADTPFPGYQIASRVAPPVPFASYVTLDNGNRVTFDGENCDLFDPAGNLLQNLGSTGAGFAFASFIVVDPTETFAICGESSNSGVFRVDLSGGGFTLLTNIVFNFAAVFDSPDTVLISAATCGFNCGNDLIRVDTSTGTQTPVGHVPGPSGPLALNSKGEVFYAVQSPLFPTPPESITLVKWSAAEALAGGLDESNWEVVKPRLDGTSSIAIDPANDHIYVAESVFGRRNNFIFHLDEQGRMLNKVISSATTWVSKLEFDTNGSGRALRRYRGETGNALTYQSTNFSTVDEIVRVEPKRAELTITGAGATGNGLFSLNVSGAMPGGKVQLWLDAQSMLAASDRTLEFSTDRDTPENFRVDMTTDLSKRAVSSAMRSSSSYNFQGLTIVADEDGNASATFFNNGRLNGEFAYQAVVMTPMLDALGLSNTVLHN